MTRRILTTILPLFLLVGCPEPEAPDQPGAGGAPDGAPAMNAPGGAPPVPEGTAPGAQDGDGNPGELPPEGAPPPDADAPPPASAPVPEGSAAVPTGQTPALEEAPMGDEKTAVGLAPDEQTAAAGLAPEEQTIPCGDGECDDAEKQDASLCPRDCAKTAPAGGDWCGDGICDALEEHKGDCAKDCK